MPFAIAGLNCHWRAASKAWFAKYRLGPCAQVRPPRPSPDGSTTTFTRDLIVPSIVALAEYGTSGNT